MKKLITNFLTVQLLLLCCCTGLYAQGTQANVAGNVSEGKASPVIGATVIVKNE